MRMSLHVILNSIGTIIRGITRDTQASCNRNPQIIISFCDLPQLTLFPRICRKQELYTSYKTKKSRSDLIRSGFSPTLYSFLPCQHVHSLFSRDSISTCIKQREDIVSGGLPGFARSGLPCPGLRSCRCSRRWRGGVFCRFPGRR